MVGSGWTTPLRAGSRVVIGQCAGEPRVLVEQLLAQTEPGLKILAGTSLGGAPWVDVALERGDTVIALHPSTWRPSHPRSRLLAIDWALLAGFLRRWRPDALLVAVAPSRRGWCRLSLSAGYAAELVTEVPMLMGEISPLAPPLEAPAVAVERFTALVDADGPPPTLSLRAPGDALDLLGDLVPDGATVEVGIGRRVNATVAALSSRRNLRFASGLICSGMAAVMEAGAVRDEPGSVVAGELIGDPQLHRYLRESSFAHRCVRLAPLAHTHNDCRLSMRPGFVAVNTAFQTDMAGRVNAEWRGDRRVGVTGGLPCFVRGALRSQGGRSITLLPARFDAIVDQLDGQAVTLCNYHADVLAVEGHPPMSVRDLTLEDRHITLRAVRSSLQSRDPAIDTIDGRC